MVKKYIGIFLCIFTFSQHLILSISNNTDQKIAVYTIPRSGSHLLMKLITELTGKNPRAKLRVNNWSSSYIFRHPYGGIIAPELFQDNFKIITIFRDPRDQLISSINFSLKNRPDAKQIVQKVLTSALINHAEAFQRHKGPGGMEKVIKLNDMYVPFLAWQNNPQIYITRFENLVGPQGGGTEKKQIEEIKKVAQFLEIQITQERIIEIARNFFGNTRTFRTGQINRWKDSFTKEHNKLCKLSCGKTLIALGYEKDMNW